MKIKKFAAVVAAAAVLAVAAPMTGVLPDTLSVTASAAEYKEGDMFYAEIDNDGNFSGRTCGAEGEEVLDLDFKMAYSCTVKSDGTIKVACILPGSNMPNLYGKALTIPEKIGEYSVSEINGGTRLRYKKVVIPDTVKIIGESAFALCAELEEVDFGANSQLTLIDQWAFQDCRSLKSVSIPASVETIAEGAFSNTKNRVQSLDDSFNSVEFTDTYSLTSVNFAAGSKLKLIDQWAFQSQKALKSITLPESLKKLGYGAFMNCTALTKVEIPENVDEIGAFAFSCGGGNDGIMSISEINVVESNKNFKSVNGVVFTKDGKTIVTYPAAKSGKYEIPADVNKIADAAFAHSTKLTSVTIPEGVTDIPENAFTYCTSLAEVKLPSSLKTIAKWGFEATALTAIDIPEGVTSIDAHAFDSSPLKTISGKTGSYAETYAKENGYKFNGGSSDKPSDPDKDKPTTFTDNSGEKAADVQVIAKPNVIPKEAHFSVRLDDSSTAERVAYNCYFTYNGAEYEPTETVTVRIPVPVAMRDIADTLKIYHLQDGKYVNMSAKVEDGYLVFDTDHFSVYVVTAKDLEKENTGDESSSEASSDSETSDNESSANSENSGDSGSGSGSDSPDTGFAGISLTLGVIALAGAAVLVARKKR